MITNLLPGFRELRAPFAAGAVMLASVYLFSYDYLHALGSSEALSPAVLSLWQHSGRARFVILGVSAYLLGSVWVTIRNALVRRASSLMLKPTLEAEYIESARKQRWFERVGAPFSRPSLRRLELLLCTMPGEVSIERVCLEIVYGGGKRLLVAHKELYDEYDRLRAEAEFRDAIAVPSLVLAAAIGVNVRISPVTAVFVGGLALAVLCVLSVQARRLDREANSMYAHAVADGVVSTAALDVGQDR